MTNPSLNLVALCIWREARGEGEPGMTAVGCVIRNRAIRHRITQEQAVMVPWAFSSMTAHGDPQIGLMPHSGDPQYGFCVQLSESLIAPIVSSQPEDITNGATLYFDDSIPFPKTWNRAVIVPTCKIGRLNFYREL